MPKLVVSVLEFDPAAIANALKITPEQAIGALQDGRGAWPFSEIWGERLYEFIKHSNTNQPASDGAVALSQLGDMNVSVKALTRGGVKFQQSKFVGYGRSGAINSQSHELSSGMSAPRDSAPSRSPRMSRFRPPSSAGEPRLASAVVSLQGRSGCT